MEEKQEAATTEKKTRGRKKAAQEPQQEPRTIEVEGEVVTPERPAIDVTKALSTPSELTTEEVLKALEQRYAGIVVDVSTTAGLAAAKASRRELVSLRTAGDKDRLDLNRPMETVIKERNAQWKIVQAKILEYETPLDTAIKAEEKKKADEKAERERIEAERKAAIQLKISNLRGFVLKCAIMNASDLAAKITQLDNYEVTEEVFAEFVEEATTAKAEVLAQLRELHDEKAKAEEEAARVQREQEEEAERLREKEAQLERERQAQEAESLRKAKIHGLIGEIRNFPADCIGLDSATIRRHTEQFKLSIGLLTDEGRAVYQEFTDEAEQVRLKAWEQVTIMIATAEKSEKEAEAQKERERQQRKENERREAEEKRKQKLQYIASIPISAMTAMSAEVAELVANAESAIIGAGDDAELAGAITAALESLKQIHTFKAQQEEQAAEQQRQKDEEARIAREQEEAEAQAERDRQAELAKAQEPETIGVDLAKEGADTTVEMVTIRKSEYDRLVKAEAKLDALESWGVDNWSGYDEAMVDYRERLEAISG